MDYKILTKEEFPEKLKRIKNSPEKLYYIGNKNLLYEESFAIVGSRRISEYGIKNCENFTRELVLRNIPIVSGMAIGTDSIAHKTSLEYGGKTIAVLGSGFENIYPESNLDLFNQIVENKGLIITEYEKNIKPNKENFPKRNRIITAISEGVLVIEAAYRSGTSITARLAIEQGKKVFAIPGKLDSTVGMGVNRLIKEGAILTTTVEDILENYNNFKIRIRKNVSCKKIRIKKEYRKIYYLLKKEPKYLEEIVNELNLELFNCIHLIAQMQLEDLVFQDISGRYYIVS